MNKDTRRLWIALAIAVFLLGLNAFTTLLGWSPLASLVDRQIERRARAADVEMTEKRNQHSEQMVVDGQKPPHPDDHDRLGENTRIKTITGRQETRSEQRVFTTEARPIAPVKPVEPERPITPAMPVPPPVPQPPGYIWYYPDGSVQYFTPPVYPVVVPVSPVQTP